MLYRPNVIWPTHHLLYSALDFQKSNQLHSCVDQTQRRSNVSRPNAFRRNVRRPNVSRPNVSRPNVSRPNVSRPNVSRPNAFRRSAVQPFILAAGFLGKLFMIGSARSNSFRFDDVRGLKLRRRLSASPLFI